MHMNDGSSEPLFSFSSFLLPPLHSPTLWKIEIAVVLVGDWFSISLHEFHCNFCFLFRNVSEDIQGEVSRIPYFPLASKGCGLEEGSWFVGAKVREAKWSRLEKGDHS